MKVTREMRFNQSTTLNKLHFEFFYWCIC